MQVRLLSFCGGGFAGLRPGGKALAVGLGGACCRLCCWSCRPAAARGFGWRCWLASASAWRVCWSSAASASRVSASSVAWPAGRGPAAAARPARTGCAQWPERLARRRAGGCWLAGSRSAAQPSCRAAGRWSCRAWVASPMRLSKPSASGCKVSPRAAGWRLGLRAGWRAAWCPHCWRGLVGGQRVGMEALLALVLAALPARLLAGELLGHGRGQLLAEGLELLDQGALLGGAGLTRGLLGGSLFAALELAVSGRRARVGRGRGAARFSSACGAPGRATGRAWPRP